MDSCVDSFSREAMSDLWIGDVGIRVTNLEKSIEFYTRVFDLEEVDRRGDDEGKYVLFRDRRAGQRVELNWYAERSPFWAPYIVGEGLDHFEVRVKSVPETLKRLGSWASSPRRKNSGSIGRRLRKSRGTRNFGNSCRTTCGPRRTGIESPTFRTPMASSSASTTTPKNLGRGRFRITIDCRQRPRWIPSRREPATEARTTGGDYFGSSMGRATIGDSLRTFGVKDARARSASPIKATQALAQIPTPSFETLPTAAMSGAPTATPVTRIA